MKTLLFLCLIGGAAAAKTNVAPLSDEAKQKIKALVHEADTRYLDGDYAAALKSGDAAVAALRHVEQKGGRKVFPSDRQFLVMQRVAALRIVASAACQLGNAARARSAFSALFSSNLVLDPVQRRQVEHDRELVEMVCKGRVELE